ncbi:MAG TPA: hypothetical protein VNO30_35695 [Kofleriaceae bacterium]|nr:hypothetical protein [Kofleriaceae bacterium]
MRSLLPGARIGTAIAVLAASTAGSAGPQQTADAPAPTATPGDADTLIEAARRCPEAMRGVALVSRPISGGVALEFTSPRRRQVPELREQLREAALAVQTYSKAPLRGALLSPGQVPIPPLDISVDDVGAGARVSVRAQRARDLPELRDLARTLQRFWSRSDCNEDLVASL